MRPFQYVGLCKFWSHLLPISTCQRGSIDQVICLAYLFLLRCHVIVSRPRIFALALSVGQQDTIYLLAVQLASHLVVGVLFIQI